MLSIKRKHYIVDEKGNPRSIILDVETYNKMLELIEDIKEYKKAKSKIDASLKSGKYVTFSSTRITETARK